MVVERFSGTSGEWDAFVASTKAANFSHQCDWLQLCSEVYGGEPHYIAAYGGARIVGVMPVMLRSVIGAGRVLYATPFADEGGCCTDDADVEAQLIQAAISLGEEVGASYLEVRQRTPLVVDGVCDQSRVTLEMPLPADKQALWESLSKNMRKKVRRAGRDGLISEEGGPEHIPSFYDIYAANMQDLGSPMHSRRFFEALFHRFPEDMLSVIVRIEETGLVVGAAVAIRFGEVLTVLCAHSAREHFELFPNNLLYWHLLEAAIEWGCRVANFGRSPVDTGIYAYKKSWHMDDHQLYYTRVPVCGQPPEADAREGRTYALFREMWRRMPSPIARAIGPRLWARLPI